MLVGIVAQGVQLDHPLLAPNIQLGPIHKAAPAGEHEIAGTHAAGVAAGRWSDAGQFSGVAPHARILPVRFTAASSPQAFDLAQAIEYAAEAGASIINIASDGDLTRPAVKRAIKYAATRNALVVCAADGADAATSARANDDDVPNLIRVLPVSEQFEPLVEDAGSAAHVAAPGFARVPLWRGVGHVEQRHFALGSAYVSGCAALVKTQNPAWGYHELKEHLLSSSTPHAGLAGGCQTGGVLNVANAVLGPIELAVEEKSLQWSSLNDAVIAWKLRYRSAYCANTVALYRSHGDEHWRELAYARAGALRMTIPAAALRRSSGTLRIACRESNFFTEEIPLTIR